MPPSSGKLLLTAGNAPELAQAFRTQAEAKGFRVDHLGAADLADYDSLLASMQRVQPVAGIFFSAPANVPDDAAWPQEFFNAINFFRALERREVEACVYSSTSAVYGANPRTPHEDAPLTPATPAGQAALAVEAVLHGLSMREEAAEDFYDVFRTHVMRVLMHYPDFNTSLFPCLRSFVLRRFPGLPVEAEARAHLLALEHQLAGGHNELANLALPGQADTAAITRLLHWHA